MPQIIEMRSLIRPQLFTFDRSVDGPFCLYAPINRDRPNTVFPLIDRRRANAEDISRSISATENFNYAAESFVRNRFIHTRESKALLWKYQALLQKTGDKDTSPMESALDLAKRLRIGQAESGVTDGEVAEACDVSPQAVGQWKKNGRVHKKHLATIAALFGKSLDWLLGNSDMENDAREQQLLLEFRALSPPLQQIAIRQVKSLREPEPSESQQTVHQPRPTYTARKGKTTKKQALGGNRADAKAIKIVA